MSDVEPGGAHDLAAARAHAVPGRCRTLQHITASPSKTGDIARAELIFTHLERSRFT